MRLPQILRSCRRPTAPTIGLINLSRPRGRTSHDQRIRVPPAIDSNVSAPSVSIIDEEVKDANAPWALIRRELDRHRHRPAHRPELRPKPRPHPDRALRDQLGTNHPRVVARLVALIGNEVEHNLNRAADDDLAFHPRHLNSHSLSQPTSPSGSVERMSDAAPQDPPVTSFTQCPLSAAHCETRRRGATMPVSPRMQR